jgi:hypothetical protein
VLSSFILSAQGFAELKNIQMPLMSAWCEPLHGSLMQHYIHENM